MIPIVPTITLFVITFSPASDATQVSALDEFRDRFAPVIGTFEGNQLRYGMPFGAVKELLGGPKSRTYGWSSSRGWERKLTYESKQGACLIELTFRTFVDDEMRLERTRATVKSKPFDKEK